MNQRYKSAIIFLIYLYVLYLSAHCCPFIFENLKPNIWIHGPTRMNSSGKFIKKQGTNNITDLNKI